MSNSSRSVGDVVLYRSLQHEISEIGEDVHGYTSGAPYYQLRCIHPGKCRDLEYIKKLSNGPGNPEGSQLIPTWIGHNLCSNVA